MYKIQTFLKRGGFAAGFAAASLLAVGIGVGLAISGLLESSVTLQLPETALHATASIGTDGFVAATGPMDENIEGLFLLDSVTGELRCMALNPRSAKFGAVFNTNVAADLGIEQGKKPQYLLVTGMINFRGATSRYARSVAYVVDASTGNFVAYAVPYQGAVANQGRPQAGGLQLLDAGTMRDTVESID